MHAKQLLEFLEQHIDELPDLMGEQAWQAFQPALQESVRQMHPDMSADALEHAVQPLLEHLNRCPQVRERLRVFLEERARLSHAPAQQAPDRQQLNQVANRFRALAVRQQPLSTDEPRQKTEPDNPPAARPC